MVGDLQGYRIQSSKYLDVEPELGLSWTLEKLEKVILSMRKKAHTGCDERLMRHLTHVFQILFCSRLYGHH